MRIIDFFRKINNAIFVLLAFNILIFAITLYWLKNNLENNLIKYTIDFYIETSKNISSRMKKYIEYEQFEAMKIILQQEYDNQNIIYLAVFNKQGANLIYFSRYPQLVDYVSKKDFISLLGKTQKYYIDDYNLNIENGEKISKLLIVITPIEKTIISDIQDKILIGYLLIVFDLTRLDNQLKTIGFYSSLVLALLSLFSIIVSIFMIIQFYKPIEYLRNLAVELSKSKFNIQRRVFWFKEFNYLVDSFIRMAQALEQQLTLLESIASLDALTKLYNRGAFEKFYNAIALESKMKIALGLNKTFAVVMLDIDNFKKINDTYGHKVGDMVLSKVAEIIKTRKRNTDIAARYGGEEFIIILNVSNKIDALKFCLDLKNIISKTEFILDDGTKLSVSASFGVAFYPEDSKDKDALVKIADDNLYNSKRKGKNRVSVILYGKLVDLEDFKQIETLKVKDFAEG